MHDKECRGQVAKLIFILRKKKILDDKDMEELFGKPEKTSLELVGKPEEIRVIDSYKL